MEKRKRYNQLILRLSDDEKYILDAKCKNAEYRNKNDYLRHLILYGYTYFVDYSELHDYNVNLSRISKSLNQIAARISSTGNTYQDDIEEVKELMKQVWRTHKSMLSKQPYRKQSFAPREVDFDTAHQVGIELADKLLEYKYSYVIATHIDKEHCHNHIIFCAVDNVEHKNIMTASVLIVILEICQMNFAENMDCRLLFRQGKKA